MVPPVGVGAVEARAIAGPRGSRGGRGGGEVARPPAAVGAVRWGYLACAPLVVLLGMGAEHAADPYRERAPSGRAALPTADPAVVRAMLGPHRPPRAKDMLWNFEIGDTLVGQTVMGRYGTFDRGGTIFAQAWVAPPHGDLVLECVFGHPDGPAIDRQKAVLPREQARYSFPWTLDPSLEPGEYRLVLALDGTPVASKTFTVK